MGDVMSDKFVASNGVEITKDVHGCVSVEGLHSLREDSQALREFFQHERDEELGRWRSKKLPDYVVYPGRNDRLSTSHERSVIMNERNGGSATGVLLSAPDGWAGSARQVIDEYNEAHPEPKPWGSAKNNEVWALRFSDQHGFLLYAVKTDEGGPRFWWTGNEGQSAGYFAREFAEGHRIFPEVSDVAE